MEGRGRGKREEGRVADSRGQEQARRSVYHRPALVHSGVPTPGSVPGTR